MQSCSFSLWRRRENHCIFLWLAKLLKMDESPILIRSMTGIIICSDSSVIFFFSLSKRRSETKPKPQEKITTGIFISFVCLYVKWNLRSLQNTFDSGTVSSLKDYLVHPLIVFPPDSRIEEKEASGRVLQQVHGPKSNLCPAALIVLVMQYSFFLVYF